MAHVFPSDSPETLVEVFFQPGDPAFVCALHGKTGGDMIERIEKDLEDEPGVLNRGAGNYLFSTHWIEEQRGFEGRIELPGYWMLDLLDFRPIQP